MASKTTVIIPALDEKQRIGTAVQSALASGASEVIVSDGGSGDGTIERAEKQGARIVTGATIRGAQLNLGAAAATSPLLLFLHADTTLPPAACRTVAEACENGVDFGGFRISFSEPSARLRFAAFMINLRSSLTRCPWGDQAQFVRREIFELEGGYREVPIMEDYDLALRMRRRHRVRIVDLAVSTSGRRFLEKGLLRTAILNWRTVIDWHKGHSPEKLAARYRRSAGRAGEGD